MAEGLVTVMQTEEHIYDERVPQSELSEQEIVQTVFEYELANSSPDEPYPEALRLTKWDSKQTMGVAKAFYGENNTPVTPELLAERAANILSETSLERLHAQYEDNVTSRGEKVSEVLEEQIWDFQRNVAAEMLERGDVSGTWSGRLARPERPEDYIALEVIGDEEKDAVFETATLVLAGEVRERIVLSEVSADEYMNLARDDGEWELPKIPETEEEELGDVPGRMLKGFDPYLLFGPNRYDYVFYDSHGLIGHAPRTLEEHYAALKERGYTEIPDHSAYDENVRQGVNDTYKFHLQYGWDRYRQYSDAGSMQPEEENEGEEHIMDNTEQKFIQDLARYDFMRDENNQSEMFPAYEQYANNPAVREAYTAELGRLAEQDLARLDGQGEGLYRLAVLTTEHIGSKDAPHEIAYNQLMTADEVAYYREDPVGYLENVYARMGNAGVQPYNYYGHSPSVGDAIVIQTPDGIECHFVDSYGFEQNVDPNRAMNFQQFRMVSLGMTVREELALLEDLNEYARASGDENLDDAVQEETMGRMDYLQEEYVPVFNLASIREVEATQQDKLQVLHLHEETYILGEPVVGGQANGHYYLSNSAVRAAMPDARFSNANGQYVYEDTSINAGAKLTAEINRRFERIAQELSQDSHIVYRYHASPRPLGNEGQYDAFVQRYERSEDGGLIPQDVVYVGEPQRAMEIANHLNARSELAEELIDNIVYRRQLGMEPPMGQEADKLALIAQTDVLREEMDRRVDTITRAMEAAGWTLDAEETTRETGVFRNESGGRMDVSVHEAEEWLDGVVFDDPEVERTVAQIMHPELFEKYDLRGLSEQDMRQIIFTYECLHNDPKFDNYIPEIDRMTKWYSEQGVAVQKPFYGENNTPISQNMIEERCGEILRVASREQLDIAYNTIRGAAWERNSQVIGGYASRLQATARESMLRQDSPWGSWFATISHPDRPEDYIELDITGYSTRNSVIESATLVLGNNVQERIVLPEMNYDEYVRGGEEWERVDTGFTDRVAELASRFDPSIREGFQLYAPNAIIQEGPDLDAHRALLRANGYPDMPNWEPYNERMQEAESREPRDPVAEIVANHDYAAVSEELEARLADNSPEERMVNPDFAQNDDEILGRAQRALLRRDPEMSQRVEVGEQAIEAWEGRHRGINLDENHAVYAMIRDREILVNELGDRIRVTLNTMAHQDRFGGYFDPQLDIDGTPEELFRQAQNGYFQSTEALTRVQEILSSPEVQSTEQAAYVGVLREIAEDNGERPYVFAQIKRDILDGRDPDEITIGGNTVSVFSLMGAPRVIVMKDNLETNQHAEQVVPVEDFMKMSPEDFERTVSEIQFEADRQEEQNLEAPENPEPKSTVYRLESRITEIDEISEEIEGPQPPRLSRERELLVQAVDRIKGRQEMLRNVDPSKIVVFDIETTGLSFENDEIIQLSIIDGNSNVLFNEYIKPTHVTEWDEAAAINGITPELVADKPTLEAYIPRLNEIMGNAELIVGYNSDHFDMTFLRNAGIVIPEETPTYDVMNEFSSVFGEWNDYRNDFRWQRLANCAEYYGYQGDGNFHDSLEDVRATLHCFNAMTEQERIIPALDREGIQTLEWRRDLCLAEIQQAAERGDAMLWVARYEEVRDALNIIQNEENQEEQLRGRLEFIQRAEATPGADIIYSSEEWEARREEVSNIVAMIPQPQQEQSISFYVAECMEFTNLGEYHEGLTLQEAFDIYEQIPVERMNAGKGIGFDLQDGSDYSGQFGLLHGNQVMEDDINEISHYRNSPLVQAAIKDCKEELDRRLEREAWALGQLQEQVPEQPSSFIESYYVVNDLHKQGALDIVRYDNLEHALAAYAALPNDRWKALGIENTVRPYQGSLDFVQCKDGVNTIVRDYEQSVGWDNPEVFAAVDRITEVVGILEQTQGNDQLNYLWALVNGAETREHISNAETVIKWTDIGNEDYDALMDSLAYLSREEYRMQREGQEEGREDAHSHGEEEIEAPEHSEGVEQREEENEMADVLLTRDSDGIEIDGHEGTWYVIDEEVIDGERVFLLEHEEYGDEAANLIVSETGELLLDDVYNGFDDYREMLEVEPDRNDHVGELIRETLAENAATKDRILGNILNAVAQDREPQEQENFRVFYDYQIEDARAFQRENGWKMIWGTDAQGLNGDSFVVYRNVEDLPRYLQDYARELEERGATEPIVNRYYYPDLDLDGTADELFVQARNGYIEDPAALAQLQEILSNPVEQKTEQAFYVGVLKEIAEDKGDQPYVFAQMKKDILDGVQPEEVSLRAGVPMELEVRREAENVLIALTATDIEASAIGATSVTVDQFLNMSAEDFERTVNEVYAHNMAKVEREPDRVAIRALAERLDNFMYDNDTYGYRDDVGVEPEQREEHRQHLVDALENNEFSPMIDTLTEIRDHYDADPYFASDIREVNDLIYSLQHLDQYREFYGREGESNAEHPIREFRDNEGRLVEGERIPLVLSRNAGFADRALVFEAVQAFEESNNIPEGQREIQNGTYEDKQFLYNAYDRYVGMSHRNDLSIQPYMERLQGIVNASRYASLMPLVAEVYYAQQNGLTPEQVSYITEKAQGEQFPDATMYILRRGFQNGLSQEHLDVTIGEEYTAQNNMINFMLDGGSLEAATALKGSDSAQYYVLSKPLRDQEISPEQAAAIVQTVNEIKAWNNEDYS